MPRPPILWQKRLRITDCRVDPRDPCDRPGSLTTKGKLSHVQAIFCPIDPTVRDSRARSSLPALLDRAANPRRGTPSSIQPQCDYYGTPYTGTPKITLAALKSSLSISRGVEKAITSFILLSQPLP